MTTRTVLPKWLPLTVQVTELVNGWARRNDLAAYLGPDGGYGQATALFDHMKGEIDINTDIAFGKGTLPSDIGDFADRDVQYDWPKATGMMFHEAAHAQHSDMNTIVESRQELSPEEQKWVGFLEESRVERRALRSYPTNRCFLRAMILDIVLKELKADADDTSSTRLLTALAILGRARVDAGILRPDDMYHLNKYIDEVLPVPMMEKLRSLWHEFFELDAHSRGDRQTMFRIAREVEKLVVANEADRGEEPGDTIPDWLKQTILAALDSGRARTEMDANGEAFDMQADERAERKAEEKRGERQVERADETRAKQMFSQNSGPGGGRTRSRMEGRRAPTAEENATATKLAKALRRAKYRDRVVIETNQIDPPGKLRTKVAMQAKAVKTVTGRADRGRFEPWRKTARKHVEDPELAVGLMCDISGSMSHTMKPMATAAWVISNAVARVRGRAAAVYYGDSAFSVLKPGEILKEVTHYTAEDGSEDFDSAFRALNGGLKLLSGHGARLLFICSDGSYRADQLRMCEQHLKACRKKGVAVVWLGLGWSSSAQELCKETGAEFVPISSGVIEASEAIGAACIKALASASQ